MKKKILIGLLIGIIAGIFDVIPMIFMKLPLQADISAFSMWLVIGFLLAVSDLKMHGIPKGLLVAFLVLLPNLFIIGWGEPMSLIPVFIMTLILGSLTGWIFHLMTKSINKPDPQKE
jgi:hypothetical protein